MSGCARLILLSRRLLARSWSMLIIAVAKDTAVIIRKMVRASLFMLFMQNVRGQETRHLVTGTLDPLAGFLLLLVYLL